MFLNSRGWGWLAAIAIPALIMGLIWFMAGTAWWSDIGNALQAMQRHLHGRLAEAMRAVQDNQSRAMWNLALLGFLYGIFHAAGPGHGKFVIATYLATTDSGVRRGVSLTLASSVLQGLTAIIVVETTVRLLGLALRDARLSASAVETASYAMLALVGAGLAVSAMRRAWRRHRRSVRGRADHESDWQGTGHKAVHAHPDDHAHGPDATELAAPIKASHALAIVLSVGLRPCSGAVLVLLFAKIMGHTLAGIVGVFAISAGTAITVSILALLAVYARRIALQLGRRAGGSGAGLAVGMDLAAAAGGLLIAIIGFFLLSASLRVIQHPLL